VSAAWSIELNDLITTELGAAISGIDSIIVDDVSERNNFAKTGCVEIVIIIRKRGKVTRIKLCCRLALTNTNTQ